MAHANRARFMVNQKRRMVKALRGLPLPLAVQQYRHAERERVKAEAYPNPPEYKQPEFGAKGRI